MAIARGAGTEIIRAHHFEDLAGEQNLIIGVQHHIYTVLSITCYCIALNATTDKLQCRVKGWDNVNGVSAQSHWIFQQNIQVGETFVWNDKFSFNGYEPTGMSAALDTVAEQDAIADQGSSTPQYLVMNVTHGSDNYDVNLTFIDQNNE